MGTGAIRRSFVVFYFQYDPGGNKGRSQEEERGWVVTANEAIRKADLLLTRAFVPGVL